MFLEILFICSCFLAALYITTRNGKKEMFPKVIQKVLMSKAIQNWQNSLTSQVPIFNNKDHIVTKDLGVFCTKEEFLSERPYEITKSVSSDGMTFYGMDGDAQNVVYFRIINYPNSVSKLHILLRLKNVLYQEHYEGLVDNSREFQLGNFRMQLVEPLRIWRIWYNGILSEEHTDVHKVHAQINILWKALDQPIDSQKHASSKLLAETFSRTGAFGEFLPELPNILPKGYSQFGTYHGSITINGNEYDPIYLYGIRLRRSENEVIAKSNRHRRIDFFGRSEKYGNSFLLNACNNKWIDGHLLHASHARSSIKTAQVEVSSFYRDETVPKLFTIHDEKRTFIVEIWSCLSSFNIADAHISLFSITINGHKGCGLLVRYEAKNNNITSSPTSMLHYINNYTNPLTSSLLPSNTKCQETDANFVDINSDNVPPLSLVGGKGLSLIKLANLAAKRDMKFQTAKGFCVTTNLFYKCVDVNRIHQMFQQESDDLDATCQRVIALIKSCGAEQEISSLIEPWMKRVFPYWAHTDQLSKFAVRSSGVLEDGTELSAAGQNDTFLGVVQNDIPSKIVHCWASLFTSQSVRYRLAHGQSAVSAMGVVVQEMIDASSAGVIFTADPVTGNPFRMIITANYGLGESVVGALSDPDTIVIKRQIPFRETEPSRLQIDERQLGEKKSKIVISAEGNGNEIREVSIAPSEASKFCLDEEQALHLGSIANNIENELGHFKPIDLEWAVDTAGKFYILQSRPITSLDRWTDFEIIHELDSPCHSMSEKYTTANVGEVIPTCLSPLGLSVSKKLLDIGIQRNVVQKFDGCDIQLNPYGMMAAKSFRYKMFLNMNYLLYRTVDPEISPPLVVLELSVFGHRVIDEKYHQECLEIFGKQTTSQKFKGLVYVAKELFTSGLVNVEKLEKKFSNFHLNLQYDTMNAFTLYQEIHNALIYLNEIGFSHSRTSERSSLMQMLCFLALSEGRKVSEWGDEIFEDSTKLLSAFSEVESADVPLAIEDLATQIIQSNRDLKEFLNIKNPQEAMEWLNQSDQISQGVAEFMRIHGHRAIAELEIKTKSWKKDPSPFISLLQSIVRCKLNGQTEWKGAKRNTYRSNDELLDSLKTPLKGSTRRFLKFLLPMSRQAVCNREKTKSLLVKTLDHFKELYTELGKKMAKERLIPDESLLVFFTHTEIGLIMEKDESTTDIIAKALKRRKLLPELEKVEYHEINTGFPKPINSYYESSTSEVQIGDIIKGTAVSCGQVEGIAKVCLNVQEAAEQIEQGDILITKATDIAWSPFFPILGGVVTELGGLISHGATVAREYGLPCIVGAANATKSFKSGDRVRLNASKGTLEKLI